MWSLRKNTERNGKTQLFNAICNVIGILPPDNINNTIESLQYIHGHLENVNNRFCKNTNLCNDTNNSEIPNSIIEKIKLYKSICDQIDSSSRGCYATYNRLNKGVNEIMELLSLPISSQEKPIGTKIKEIKEIIQKQSHVSSSLLSDVHSPIMMVQQQDTHENDKQSPKSVENKAGKTKKCCLKKSRNKRKSYKK
jgi:hypothetical protein